LEALRLDTGRRVRWVWVYTAEAHPAGSSELARNAEQAVSVNPHADLDGRKQHAKELARLANLNGDLAVDPMNATLSETLGTFPTGAVVLDADLKIVARDEWADPFALRQALDAL
jgi:hypothetical protein